MSADISLVTLMQEIREIELALLASDGELTPELEEKFNLSTGDLRTKVDRYKIVIDAMTASSVYFKERSDEMVRARRIMEGHKERLKDTMKFVMHSMGKSDMEGRDWRFKLIAMKDKLVLEEAQLPEKYFKEEKVRVPDVERITGDLMLGTEIPGASLAKVDQLRSYVHKLGRAREVTSGSDS